MPALLAFFETCSSAELSSDPYALCSSLVPYLYFYVDYYSFITTCKTILSFRPDLEPLLFDPFFPYPEQVEKLLLSNNVTPKVFMVHFLAVLDYPAHLEATDGLAIVFERILRHLVSSYEADGVARTLAWKYAKERLTDAVYSAFEKFNLQTSGSNVKLLQPKALVNQLVTAFVQPNILSDAFFDNFFDHYHENCPFFILSDVVSELAQLGSMKAIHRLCHCFVRDRNTYYRILDELGNSAEPALAILKSCFRMLSKPSKKERLYYAMLICTRFTTQRSIALAYYTLRKRPIVESSSATSSTGKATTEDPLLLDYPFQGYCSRDALSTDSSATHANAEYMSLSVYELLYTIFSSDEDFLLFFCLVRCPSHKVTDFVLEFLHEYNDLESFMHECPLSGPCVLRKLPVLQLFDTFNNTQKITSLVANLESFPDVFMSSFQFLLPFMHRVLHVYDENSSLHLMLSGFQWLLKCLEITDYYDHFLKPLLEAAEPTQLYYLARDNGFFPYSFFGPVICACIEGENDRLLPFLVHDFGQCPNVVLDLYLRMFTYPTNVAKFIGMLSDKAAGCLVASQGRFITEMILAASLYAHDIAPVLIDKFLHFLPDSSLEKLVDILHPRKDKKYRTIIQAQLQLSRQLSADISLSSRHPSPHLLRSSSAKHDMALPVSSSECSDIPICPQSSIDPSNVLNLPSDCERKRKFEDTEEEDSRPAKKFRTDTRFVMSTDCTPTCLVPTLSHESSPTLNPYIMNSNATVSRGNEASEGAQDPNPNNSIFEHVEWSHPPENNDHPSVGGNLDFITCDLSSSNLSNLQYLQVPLEYNPDFDRPSHDDSDTSCCAPPIAPPPATANSEYPGTLQSQPCDHACAPDDQ